MFGPEEVKLTAGSLSDPERMQEWRSTVTFLTVLAAVLACRAGVAGEQATYDQRQNGDLNVQVHLQDVGILALLDENLFSGGYGVSEFTVQTHVLHHTAFPSIYN